MNILTSQVYNGKRFLEGKEGRKWMDEQERGKIKDLTPFGQDLFYYQFTGYKEEHA